METFCHCSQLLPASQWSTHRGIMQQYQTYYVYVNLYMSCLPLCEYSSNYPIFCLHPQVTAWYQSHMQTFMITAA